MRACTRRAPKAARRAHGRGAGADDLQACDEFVRQLNEGWNENKGGCACAHAAWIQAYSAYYKRQCPPQVPAEPAAAHRDSAKHRPTNVPCFYFSVTSCDTVASLTRHKSWNSCNIPSLASVHQCVGTLKLVVTLPSGALIRRMLFELIEVLGNTPIAVLLGTKRRGASVTHHNGRGPSPEAATRFIFSLCEHLAWPSSLLSAHCTMNHCTSCTSTVLYPYTTVTTSTERQLRTVLYSCT